MSLVRFETKIEAKTMDLSSHEDIDGFWKEVDGAKVDILVNNAGIYSFKKYLEVEPSFLNKVMEK